MNHRKFKSLSEIIESKKIFASIHKQANSLKLIQSIWKENRSNTSIQKQIQLFFKHSFPVRIQHNTLHVLCETPLIINHARFMHNDIISELKNQKVKQISTLEMQLSHDFNSVDAFSENNIQTISKIKIDREINIECITLLEQFSTTCQSEVLKKSVENLMLRMKKEKQ